MCGCNNNDLDNLNNAELAARLQEEEAEDEADAREQLAAQVNDINNAGAGRRFTNCSFLISAVGFYMSLRLFSPSTTESNSRYSFFSPNVIPIALIAAIALYFCRPETPPEQAQQNVLPAPPRP
jgi:hypothetical protein